MTHNAAGQLTGFTLGNGVQEAITYDVNRLQLRGIQATKGSATLMNLTYNYSAQAGQLGTGTVAGNAGQIIGVTGAINGLSESAAFTYDDDRRIATSTQTSNGQTAGRSFAWDRFGNRLSVTDTIANAQIQSATLAQSGGVTTNQIASVNNGGVNSNYTYDAVGNVTADGS